MIMFLLAALAMKIHIASMRATGAKDSSKSNFHSSCDILGHPTCLVFQNSPYRVIQAPQGIDFKLVSSGYRSRGIANDIIKRVILAPFPDMMMYLSDIRANGLSSMIVDSAAMPCCKLGDCAAGTGLGTSPELICPGVRKEGVGPNLIDKLCAIIGTDVSDILVETDLYLLQEFDDELLGFIFRSQKLNPGLNGGNSCCEKEKTMEKLEEAEQTAIERATAQFRPQALANTTTRQSSLSALENMHYSQMIRFDNAEEARKLQSKIDKLKQSSSHLVYVNGNKNVSLLAEISGPLVYVNGRKRVSLLAEVWLHLVMLKSLLNIYDLDCGGWWVALGIASSIGLGMLHKDKYETVKGLGPGCIFTLTAIAK
ncbi:hypothetical protein Tco_0599198 [Tanacetum coccineum]